MQLVSCVTISAALLVDVSPFGLHAPPSGIRHLELMHVAPVWHWAFLSQANPNATLESIHFFSLRLQSPLVCVSSHSLRLSCDHGIVTFNILHWRHTFQSRMWPVGVIFIDRFS